MSRRVGVVVSVLAVAMLAAGCINPGEPAIPRAYFSAPHLEARTVNNTTVWDCTINVTRITPGNEKLSWAGVTVNVKAATSRLLISSTGPDLYGGSPAPSPKAYRVEAYGSWLTMDVGDAIRLTSIDESFLDSEVDVEFQDSQGTYLLGFATLPSAFPG
jgi:hypothetical protein